MKHHAGPRQKLKKKNPKNFQSLTMLLKEFWWDSRRDSDKFPQKILFKSLQIIEELQLQLENDRKIIPDGVSIKSLIEFRPNCVKISAGFLNKKNLKGFTKSPKAVYRISWRVHYEISQGVLKSSGNILSNSLKCITICLKK